MSDQQFEKACINGDLKTVKQMVENNNDYRDWISEDEEYHQDVINWNKYGDLPDKITIDTKTLINMINSIKSHRFCGGDWESEMEYNERGGGYECNVPSYIRDMENLVETLHKRVSSSKIDD